MLVLTDVVARGDVADAIAVNFDPRPFAPGLSRHIDVVLTPQTRRRSDDLECTGSLQFDLVTIVPLNNAVPPKTATFSLPVYYKC